MESVSLNIQEFKMTSELEVEIKKLIKKTKNEIEIHRTHKRVYRRGLKTKIREYYDKRKLCDFYLKECHKKISNYRIELEKIKQERQ